MKRQTVVIFDGPDKCGKTEMARALSKALSIPYFKNTSEWDAFSKSPDYFANALRFGDDYFYRFLRDTGTSCILDRSYPSEWVYSKVYNRQTFEEGLQRVDAMASSFDTRIVIPYRSSYAGMKDDVHDISEDDLVKIDRTYWKFFQWTKCKSLMICVDDENLDREIHDIREFLLWPDTSSPRDAQ